MKNKRIYLFFTFIIFIFLNFNLFSEELNINASKIKYKDQNKVTIFESTVTAEDSVGNKLFSEYADYNDLTDILKTKGYTKIITSGGFEVLGSDIFLDNKQKTIYSNNKTQVIDQDGNKIFLDMFNYSILTNVFFSKGNIKVTDINNNNYSFSEVYIDENKKKIIGTDVKAFLKQSDILKLRNEARDMIKAIRSGEGPQFLEAHAYRWLEHVGPGDDWNLGYRSQEEIRKWEKDDQVEHLGELLPIDLRICLEKEINNEVAESMIFAEKSPFPSREELTKHVYK